MGGNNSKIAFASKPPTVVMLVGLQGAGKTTHCAKLAAYFKSMGKRPLLVACDIYRPAAILQLKMLGEKASIPVFSIEDGTKPSVIAEKAVKHAKDYGNDIVFLDTAGRLHIDEALMNELAEIKSLVNPNEILLTVDAMTGQDAVNVAESFNNTLSIDGVVLTKTDGDTRGGAALSVLYVTNKPIKFMGTGEKIGDIEPFHPERMASRILGMGDVLSLIEKAEKSFDEKKAAELEKKLKTKSFDLNDFLDQMRQMKNLGPLDQLLGMMPGVNQNALKNAKIDNNMLNKTEAIILSMTKKEREKPDVLNASRRKRIAQGSGTKVEDVNRLIKSFDQMKDMMKKFSGKNFGKLKNMKFPF
jgi:signal recognition particle subunit SRP54